MNNYTFSLTPGIMSVEEKEAFKVAVDAAIAEEIAKSAAKAKGKKKGKAIAITTLKVAETVVAAIIPPASTDAEK